VEAGISLGGLVFPFAVGKLAQGEAKILNNLAMIEKLQVVKK